MCKTPDPCPGHQPGGNGLRAGPLGPPLCTHMNLPPAFLAPTEAHFSSSVTSTGDSWVPHGDILRGPEIGHGGLHCGKTCPQGVTRDSEENPILNWAGRVWHGWRPPSWEAHPGSHAPTFLGLGWCWGAGCPQSGVWEWAAGWLCSLDQVHRGQKVGTICEEGLDVEQP